MTLNLFCFFFYIERFEEHVKKNSHWDGERIKISRIHRIISRKVCSYLPRKKKEKDVLKELGVQKILWTDGQKNAANNDKDNSETMDILTDTNDVNENGNDVNDEDSEDNDARGSDSSE